VKRFEDISIGNRIAITFIIVVVILLLLAVVGYLTGSWDEAVGQAHREPQLYADGIPLDAKLLALDKEALDEAYHRHLLLLFSVWLKGEISDSSRISNGLRIARRAYNQAAQQIVKREQQLHEQEQRK
jgi:hypothetical protein